MSLGKHRIELHTSKKGMKIVPNVVGGDKLIGIIGYIDEGLINCKVKKYVVGRDESCRNFQEFIV